MSRATRMRILIGLTSHGDLGGQRSTGYYLSEAAHPWRVFVDAGYAVDLASTAGGEPPVDQSSVDLTDAQQRSFTEDPEVGAKLRQTLRFDEVDSDAYDAVFFAGGHGAMWDFPADAALARFTGQLYAEGGVVAAVCHGPAALLGVTGGDGRPLVAGLQVSAFTNEEEAAVGLDQVVPFLLQTRLEELGAVHSGAPPFAPHVVSDARVVTGQNPASAAGVATAVLAALGR